MLFRSAYYSESFGFGKYAEGQVIAEDIDSLVERYSKRHGEAIGCVMLSPVNLSVETTGMVVSSYYEQMPFEMRQHLDSISNVMFIAEIFTTAKSREA